MYYSGDDCVDGYSETSHGNGQGYSKSIVHALKKSGTDTNCGQEFYRPPGSLRVRQALMYRFGNGWSVCGETGYLYNRDTASYMTVTRTYTGVCSPQTYDTQSFAHEYNGYWKGGILWSGGHWLPT
jgi:hypothetical protein